MTRPTLIIGVYGHSRTGERENIASFFNQSDADDFAMHPERDGFEDRNCYVDHIRYDRRVSGYRPAAKPSGYEDWLVEIGIAPDNGNVRVAA